MTDETSMANPQANPEQAENLVIEESFAELVEQVLSGQPQPVDMEQIEHALDELWRRVAAAQASPEQPTPQLTITRAHAVNMVVFVKDRAQIERVDQALKDLALNKPARAIVLVEQEEPGPEAGGNGPTAPSELQAWIATLCHRPDPAWPYVCSERVTIAAPRALITELHSAVVSLFVSDVPSVLWWCAPLPEEAEERHLFSRLAGNVDLLVFSAGAFRAPLKDLQRLPALAQEEIPGLPAISELTWLGIHPWREMVARPFDDPEHRALLPYVESVTVRYVAGGDVRRRQFQPVAPALLVAWLAERLAWRTVMPLRFSPQGIGACEFAAEFQPYVSVELIPAALPGAAPGTIIGVELNAHRVSPGRDAGGRFRMERLGDGSWVRTLVRIQGQVRLERIAQFRGASVGELLAQVVGQLAPDTIFLRVLEKLAEMQGPA